jgi:hypothetical protein
VFTAWYALSPYIKQTRLTFKGFKEETVWETSVYGSVML